MNIKVMTYNIHHGKGMDKQVDLKRIAKVISNSEADIIGLNEVDKTFSKRSDFIDQVQFLAKELDLFYAYSPSLTRKSKNSAEIQQYGNGLLSRYPIMKDKHHLFNFIPGLIEGRSILEATIELDQRFLNVYVTHLSLNPRLHRKQTEFILENTKEPGVILGDWNMYPNTKKWRRVVGSYRDVWQEAGKGTGYTYPSTKPRARIDYIFTTKEIGIEDIGVIETSPIASDHLPVMATLSI
ncbi:MAG: endonuclease/exonuclease/phosphatase family protein [Bacillota bacterium]